MLNQVIQLTTILFLLSMICERIADFLKHYLSESHLFKIQKEFFRIGDTLTKFPSDGIKEKERAYRILKINIWSGILLAAILKADLIKIFNDIENPGNTLGWNNLEIYKIEGVNWYQNPNYWFLPFGIILTGGFISFGSKFWHDLLDILYQIKNAKRVLADPETYKIDNIKTLQNLFNTYQSDFIKAAYLEAKSKYMAFDKVNAIGIKSNDLGYYFEITVTQNEPTIGQYFQYLLDDGTPQNIPIKIVLVTDEILAHKVDLSARVFDINRQDNWGTLGVLVKPIDSNASKHYLLTCCHNVVYPIRNVSASDPNPIKVGTIDLTTIELGNVVKANRDHEMDAALIEIDRQKIDISNYIPNNGTPQNARELVNSDRNNLKVYIFGAKSGFNEGIVTSLYNEIKIKYSANDVFTIVDTIAVSNNGNSISQSGDSGSCVVDEKNNVIGLVVAGNSKTTYILPIKTLLNKLNVKLV
jgi:hypothetical protein